MFNCFDKRLKIKNNYFVLLIYLGLLCLHGCATTSIPGPKAGAGASGVYHRIEKGQTLWRISKIYNVDLEELAKINCTDNTARIETGQLIFIPGARRTASFAKSNAEEEFIWPVKGRVINPYGSTVSSMLNKGINILPYSNKDVVASRSGKVVFCSDNFHGYGKTVIIEHSNDFLTVYAASKRIFVKPGQWVQKGSLIAETGQDMDNNSGYLHFEIRKGPLSQNPLFYLPR